MIKNVVSKVLKYGVLNSSQVILQGFKKKRFRKKNHVSFIWQTIAQKHHLPSFVDFYKQLKNNNFILDFESTPFKKYLNSPSKNLLLQKANGILNNQFEILGYNQQFEKDKILWQQDFKSNIKPENIFYQDIKIQPLPKIGLDDHLYDVKSPWELSRFQHLFYLGKAYEITQHENYPKKFVQLTEDWLNKNPFLMGVNWMCPMEVAIRSINFVWGFHYFKDAQYISLKFWEKFICSLYEHAYYLENNWEIFFKNNNHYIADLLGYFYLSLFFKDIKHFGKKQSWCCKKLLKEFYRQVLPDGASYEGSTNYHKLVTEMYLHFQILCTENDFYLPETFKSRFDKMLKFLQYCSDHKNNLIQVGDNDSGKILTGINIPTSTKDGLYHYPDFGISIIKTPEWHISLRHPTFQKQPSGHFHCDELAVTLSINGIPVLVDPGTYVYSGNPRWRNLMRLEENHNGPYSQIQTQPPPLFELPRKKQTDTSQITETSEAIYIENMHKKSPDLTSHRCLIFEKNKQSLILEDWWSGRVQTVNSFWSFIFHPQITLYKKIRNDRAMWEIAYHAKTVAYFTGPEGLVEENGHYSEGYGKIEKTTKLTMAYKTDTNRKLRFTILRSS